ncbi:hypothetical protein D4764_14G0006910 [Takifugu flavidus]|uniref:Uncharacterized protein n=1 Tax=Takifugu flavidus TaxID=433684 RepID=A0A5C6P7D7_9TELE|nr:hypothetical protein D4764_14G0006910 [Takifugu flavidus]
MDSGSAAGESDAKKDNSEQDDGDATSSKLLCRWLPPMYREELYQTMKLTGPMAETTPRSNYTDHPGWVAWEERIEEANERKRAKYQELVEECRGRGWRTFYEPIEVGCRGFAGRSLCKAFGRLGITGTAKKRAIKAASEAAEKATRWLWLKRADLWVATGTQAGS